MRSRRWMIAVCASALLTAQTKSRATDDLIVPGVRVGPVSRTSTERSLLQSLGKAAVKADVDVGEGMTEPGLIIYNDDPTRRLAVVWDNVKPAHPSAVFICYGELCKPCRWHTASGIGQGTTLEELERRNGKAFEMVVWGSDVGGNVTSFEEGKLEQELESAGRLLLTLTPRFNEAGQYVPKLTEAESAGLDGKDIVSSSLAALQKLNPYVAGMTLDFRR